MNLSALAASIVLLAAPLSAAEVTIFAAASLQGPLDRAAEAWQAESGHRAIISYGGSSALARQIEQGAPADVFLSAADSWMDRLAEAKLIVPQTRVELYGNTLVLIAADPVDVPLTLGAGADLAKALGEEKLAMALVDSVPAGQYGKAALEALGQWQAVEPQVVQAQDVKATLTLVTSGEAGFGIVYATDALASGAHVVATFPDGSHPPIRYPGAVLAGSQNPAAEEFLRFLKSPHGAAAFVEAGFALLP